MSAPEIKGVTSVLGEFAATAALAGLPPAVLEQAARLLASTLEAARAAAAPEALRSVLSGLESPPDCTVIGSTEKLGATYAAFLNGSAAHRPGVAAFGAALAAEAVVPACLAAAEVAERSGPDLLFGVSIGLECALRLARGLGAPHEARGFQLLGSAGRLGAALGASRTLGHDAGQAAAAIGFAATESGGPLRAAADDAGSLLAGKAAADGLEAALLAGAGLIGPPAPLEGRRGLFALEAGADGELLAGLGTSFLLAGEPPAAPAELVAAARALLEDGSAYGLLDALGPR